jgi:hypothetical protein
LTLTCEFVVVAISEYALKFAMIDSRSKAAVAQSVLWSFGVIVTDLRVRIEVKKGHMSLQEGSAMELLG